MHSKKQPATSERSKRTSLPRATDYTRAFHKDWERLSHSEGESESGAFERGAQTCPIKAQSAVVARATASICNAEGARFCVTSERVGFALTLSGRYDMRRLKQAMLELMQGDAPLGPQWRDHALKGDWADHRECHIGGDFLLIYQLVGNRLCFVRAGSHADLFAE